MSLSLSKNSSQLLFETPFTELICYFESYYHERSYVHVYSLFQIIRGGGKKNIANIYVYMLILDVFCVCVCVCVFVCTVHISYTIKSIYIKKVIYSLKKQVTLMEKILNFIYNSLLKNTCLIFSLMKILLMMYNIYTFHCYLTLLLSLFANFVNTTMKINCTI